MDEEGYVKYKHTIADTMRLAEQKSGIRFWRAAVWQRNGDAGSLVSGGIHGSHYADIVIEVSVAEVIDRAGQPSRTIQLENVYGAGVGERWEYYRGKKQYNVWLSGGKVVKVDEQ